ncbi:MAG TPA: phosphate uptake regulator PhoU [Methanomicrobiales archaeon]|nr:phosphate uptake regulator PhoU [Methanomicrobiales archaeon]
MEIRKVQVTGGASYIISLPKEWARSQKIKKNDPLGVLIQPDGTLLVTPKISGEGVQRERVFEVKRDMDPVYLFRLLIATYIAGFSVIRIRAHERLPPFVRAVVRDFTQMTIGQEVAEETDNSITVKDLLNPREMPMERTLSRMAVIVRSMHQDAMTALLTQNRDLAADVVNRDKDVDRLHWLVARQYNLILSDPNLARSMKITQQTASSFYIHSRLIERIGDHAVRIAENAESLAEKRLEPSERTALSESMDMALRLFTRGVEAFSSDDPGPSEKVIEDVAPLEARCAGMDTMAQHHKGEVANSLGRIIGSIRRIGEYTEDICENIINHAVAEHMPGIVSNSKA